MTIDFLFILNSVLFGVALAMDAFSVSVANAIREPSMKKKRMCLIASVYAFFQFAMPMIGWFCVHTVVEHLKRFQDFLPYISFLLLLFIGGKMIIESIKEKRSGRKASGKEAVATGTDFCEGDAELCEGRAVLCEGDAELCEGRTVLCEGDAVLCEGRAVHSEGDAVVCESSAGVCEGGEAPSKNSSVQPLSFFVLLLQGVATSIDALSVGFTIADYFLLSAIICCLIIAQVTFCISFTGLLIGKKIGERISSGAEIFGGVILIFIGAEIFVKSFFNFP